MASTPESKVKARVKALLDEYGAYHFPPNMGGFGRSGIPDIIACHKGRFIAIECKAGNSKPTALQLREIERIIKVGGVALVVNEEGIEALRSVLASQ